MKNEYLRELLASLLGNLYAKAHTISISSTDVIVKLGQRKCRSSHANVYRPILNHGKTQINKSIPVLRYNSD